jgi:hypothetical protein
MTHRNARAHNPGHEGRRIRTVALAALAVCLVWAAIAEAKTVHASKCTYSTSSMDFGVRRNCRIKAFPVIIIGTTRTGRFGWDALSFHLPRGSGRFRESITFLGSHSPNSYVQAELPNTGAGTPGSFLTVAAGPGKPRRFKASGRTYNYPDSTYYVDIFGCDGEHRRNCDDSLGRHRAVKYRLVIKG